MHATRHLIVGDINRHGLHIADTVYGILCQHGNEACLVHEFQERVDIIQFDTNLELIVIRHYVVEGIAGLQPLLRERQIVFFKLGYGYLIF